MPDGREVDVLEGGTGPRWWEVLPRGARWSAVALVVLVLAAVAVVRVRADAAERARAERIDLATTLGVWSSSTSPPGGQVSFSVLVRNDGELPVSVTSVDGHGAGLLLRMRDDDARAVPPGVEVEIPLSVRLSCSEHGANAGAPLLAELAVRRSDGGSTVRQVDLEPAALLLDVAGTLCAVRPDLRDHELSGPVLRGGAAKDPAGR